MRRLTTRILVGAILLLSLATKTNAQSIIDPNDPVLEYDPAHPPANPDWAHPLVKWVRTLHIANNQVLERNNGWTGDTYKSYNYNGLAFRVRFPKSYDPNANDGKKYPLLIFLHGQGENSRTWLGPAPPYGSGSPNFDNQWQLLQGPPQFDKAIEDGTYDGFVLAPQLQDDTLSQWRKDFFQGTTDAFMHIVKYMITNNKVDPFHIVVDGLSEGGVAVWRMLDWYPTYMSAGIAISAPTTYVDWSNVGDYFKKKRYTPIWTSQGGRDNHPTPAETQRVVDSMERIGANFRLLYYPNADHWTWYQVWAEPDFWPVVNNAYASNPWAQFGKTKFWPGETINTTIGITPGFDNYEWRRNGVLIVGSNSNELHVTGPGVYDARVYRDGMWSDWSHVPVTITGDSYRIEAEDWVAQSGARTEVTSDVDGNLNVGYLANGDWMDYTIDPYAAGVYQLKLRLAGFGTGQLEIRSSDSTVLAVVDVPNTGGWQKWVTVPVNLHLTSDLQNIRLKIVSPTTNDVVNVNWLDFYLVSADASLPVKFEYFNAQCLGDAVNLQWKTGQEQNSAKFAVERSDNGTSWSQIGTVNAAGQSSAPRTYSFRDAAPASARSYYRIVEYDIDGRSVVSSTVRSSCSGTDNIRLYPNPTRGNASISLRLSNAAAVTLKLVDAAGAAIMQQQLQLPAGTTTIPINIASLPKGVYTVYIFYDDQSRAFKLLKK